MSGPKTAELEAKVAQFGEHEKSLREQNEAIVNSAEIVDGVVAFPNSDGTKERETFQKNLATIKEIVAFREVAERALAGETAGGEGDKGLSSAALAAAAAAAGGFQGMPGGLMVPRKTVGETFIESDAFKELDGGKNGFTMRKPTEFNLKDLGGFYVGRSTKDVYTAMPSGDPGSFGGITRDPMVERQRRRSRVRDLFPSQNTANPVIQFFRQTGFVNAASPVPERNVGNTGFGQKPHSTLSFEGVTANVRTIAHWEVAHRNVLADEPQLRGIIDTELLYGLQLAEDAQILSGTGAGEDLPGILNDTGIQTYSWSEGEDTPADNKADALRRAMTLITLAYYEPTGIVVHDSDWEDIELSKDDNGQYLVATAVAIGAEPRLWRVPVVMSPAIPAGTALVGAFGLGAQLYDREDASIRVAEQHGTLFIENGVLILAEERLALAVKRPEAFVEVTFDHAPT